MQRLNLNTLMNMPTSFRRLVALLMAAPLVHAATLVDVGFEAYDVEPGTFVRPATGPWSFDNDAAVVKPFAPPTSTGSFNTWSAALSPWEGEQYASTYAGGDRLQQTVTFDAPGVFELSVYAAAPAGTLTLPGIATVTLGDGEFRFTIDGFYLSPLHTVAAGSDWTRYGVEIQIEEPGDYTLGIANVKIAPYFINYDGFAITPVPEPATCGMAMALVGLALAGAHRWRVARQSATAERVMAGPGRRV